MNRFCYIKDIYEMTKEMSGVLPWNMISSDFKGRKQVVMGNSSGQY